ncbi:hypothetical protein QWY16_04460 [Planococcus shenhongbingii]|uniref:DUF421 domain-containing protein n=1 Tax=Planococcus shenhongbingii TaxID=3058398 RepID=A0ABT8NEV5_9BACL|nr:MULTISPECIES: hypothetical protein [unclassified Planococcus (in: firmicutes)]MDN7246420.1 hypothetical protein [Planococcus sp. N017]WKA59412.1 hypothetical protein QWY16_04460 [Planococcus sp. N016]
MTSMKNTIGLTVQIVGIGVIAINFFRAVASIDLIGGSLAFDIFIQGVLYGVLLLGFGEVINLLQGIFNQRELEDGHIQQKTTALTNDNEKMISSDVKQQIKEIYTKKKVEIESIEETPYEGYAIVHYQGKRDIIDLNGFHPRILADQEVKNHSGLKELMEREQ